MYFNKVETTSNFVYGKQDLLVESPGSNVYRIRGRDARWPRGSDSIAALDPSSFAGKTAAEESSLVLGTRGEFSLTLGGRDLLVSKPGRGFGVCGKKWVMAFPWHQDWRFYGMGEKSLGFELSEKRTRFWNTDIFADFAFDHIEKASTDPMYANFPVLIVKTPAGWLGIIIDNPHGAFMNTGAKEGIFQPGAGPFVPELFFGAQDGEPDVWLVADSDPAVVVQKIQRLQGCTPLPPLWALGHQQCRWGYRSYADLDRLATEYENRGIPNDGLWLDIDYMDGFRVFTVDNKHFPAPSKEIASLKGRGFRVVPILDPGLRSDPAYRVYAEAKAQDILCTTPEGTEFIGFVWPGYTVFPDFSLPEARAFWAEEVSRFSELGFDGYWIDMNDPSTGSVPLEDMTFSRGSLPHSAWHNQYALGMAMATRAGLQKQKPGERAFVISRSAFLGQARHSAVWTGDNLSNVAHMKGTIPLSLNLSVSGMPFNGPDVPGFAMDASDELMVAWYKLGFLFPFLRNHKIQGARDQEPWTRGEAVEAVVGDYIRLRYKLLPYLYQCFVEQASSGAPMLRPVWYHDQAPAFERCDDTFFVGPAILQAPFTDLEARSRKVLLPRHQAGTAWYDVLGKVYRRAGDSHIQLWSEKTSPLYLASPSIIPLQEGIRTKAASNLARLEVLLVIRPGEKVEMLYQLDDGISTDWEDGKVSRFVIRASAPSEKVLSVEVEQLSAGYGGIALSFLVVNAPKLGNFLVNGSNLELKEGVSGLAFVGSEMPVRESTWILIGG